MTKEQVSVCIAAAKHFGVKKQEVINQVKKYWSDIGIVDYCPTVEIEFGVYGHLRIRVSKNTLRLGLMLYSKYFKKSSLYTDFVEMEDSELSDVLCFFSGGKLMCVYRATEYSGMGGIFIRDNESTYVKGFVIEPFEHYLENHYKVYREMD